MKTEVPPKEFALMLNGVDVRKIDFPTDLQVAIAKENNLIFVYGWSDDLVEMAGAIEDEADKYQGGKVHFNLDGFCSKKKSIATINAKFGGDRYGWHFKTKIPHEVFELSDSQNDEPGIDKNQGIVFCLNDINHENSN